VWNLAVRGICVRGVRGLGDWATEDERIEASIRSGLFVPVNVGGDGVFQVVVWWGAGTGLTAEERRFLVVSSEPYRLVSTGDFVLGGLEDVGDTEFAAIEQVALRGPLPAAWA